MPLIDWIDRAAGEYATAYGTSLTAQDVADFLGLQLGSEGPLAYSRHIDSLKVGNKVLIKLGELRRYLEEGPSLDMTT